MRLYAEDPRTFLPQAGRIERLRLPDGIRVDPGVEEGDEVGLAYDPLIAKLIAHGPTRAEALDAPARRARRDPGRGRVTNLPFLRWLVAHPAVRAGRDDDGLPDGLPAAVEAAGRAALRPVARRVAAQPPEPRPAPPPDLETAAHDQGPPASRARSPRRCPARW